MKIMKVLRMMGALALLAVFAVPAFAGGKNEEGSGGSQTRVIRWMTIRANQPAWDLVAKQYEREHPEIRVEFERISDQPSYFQKVKILAAGNELPDMFDSEGDALLTEIAATGVLKDIDELYRELNYDRMVSIGKNYARLDNGRLYSLAWENNIEYFWYRKSLFTKAGIAKTPETFDEFLEVCRKLKAAGIAPIAVAGNTSWPNLRWLAFIPFRLTGNKYIEDLKAGKARMGDPVGIQTAEFFQTLGKEYFQPGWPSCDYTSALEIFLSGNAAMYNIGSWQFGSFMGPDREPKEDYGFFYMPTLKGAVNGKTDMVAHAGTGTSIRKDKCDDQFKDFIKYFLNAYPETYFKEMNAFPAMTFDTTSAAFSKFDQQVMDDCNALTSFAYCWDVRLDTATNEVMTKELVNLGMGVITPQEFARRIDAAIAKNAAR
jgi:raffinose/stachyose/melibiose transport system substrate-binding protein